jgi:hypothetical protein
VVDDRIGAAGEWIFGKRQRIARALGSGQSEARIGHAERNPQALLQHGAERLACHGLDNEAQHVGREAVFPVGARIEQQRRLGQRGNGFILGHAFGGPHRGAWI